MKKGTVAIVGSPNVGKSTLFNKLTRSHSAIVDVAEGITRDKIYGTVELEDRYFKIIDTGGLPYIQNDFLHKNIYEKIVSAIKEAELVLFVVDAKLGITFVEDKIAKLLREFSAKTLLIANKVDSEKNLPAIYDLLKLGFGEAIPIAALHGRGIKKLKEKIQSYITPINFGQDLETIKIAIVGHPNVGKSSIINRMTGDDISIVNPLPNTTRDTIRAGIRYKGKNIVFLDTAGLRRKSKVKYGVDYFSSVRSLNAIKECDIALLVLDATQSFSNQDQKIAAFAKQRYKNIIVILNKWDLVKKETKTFNSYKNRFYKFFPFLKDFTFITTSAISGQRIRAILDLVLQIDKKSKKRITTGLLNKFLEKTIQTNPPITSDGKFIKLHYMTQVQVQPPEFVFFCKKCDFLKNNYKKFLEKRLKKEFDFEAVIIKLTFKKETTL